jgi:MFS family permease
MISVRRFGKQTFSSLRIRNYRLYFTGQLISMIGTWMQSIAQAWLVLKLTGSGTSLGLVTALQTLPVLLFGPWGGLIADRFPKRRTIYITQTAAGILSLIVGLLVATDTIRLWMLYVLAPWLGIIRAVDNPTRQTFIMEMVGKDELVNAVTLNSSSVNLTRVIGPAVAGALIAKIGLAPCFLLDAASYVPVLIMIYLLREEELHTAPPVERAKGQLMEGFRYVRSTPLLFNTLMMMAIIGTFTYEFQVILPLFAQFTFHGTAATYAALTSAMGVGAVIGGLYTASRKREASGLLVKAACLFGFVILVAAVMPTFHLAVAAMVLVGACSIGFTSLGNSTLQLESAEAMRGRVMALWTVAFMGSTPIGGPIIGWIGEHVGPRWGLAVGGSAAIFAGVLSAFLEKKERKRRTVSKGEGEVPPASPL